MTDGAHLASTEAIEAFRTQLVLALSRTRPVLDAASESIRRTRAWLQSDRLPHWQHEIKRRERILERAEQELFQARLSAMKDDLSLQMQAVHKAKRSLEEATTKLRLTKRWIRDFDSIVEPLGVRLERARDFFATDLPNAVVTLSEVLRSLGAYMDIRPGAVAAPESTGNDSPEPP